VIALVASGTSKTPADDVPEQAIAFLYTSGFDQKAKKVLQTVNHQARSGGLFVSRMKALTTDAALEQRTANKEQLATGNWHWHALVAGGGWQLAGSSRRW
jgi:hypothetical protein